MLSAPLACAAICHLFADGGNERMTIVATTEPLDAARLRQDFPILASTIHGDKPLVYLDNAATTQRPRQVIQALVDTYEKSYANVHRGIHWLSDQSTDLYEEAREKVRELIGARRSQEVIFTTGTTAAINLVARSWGDATVGPGDELLLSVMEHHSNLVPWQQLAQRTGCTLRHLPITDDGQLCLDQLPGLLSERTRLVAITAVSNVLGTINPLPSIIDQAHAAGALVLVDAAQSVPHIPTDVQALDADFLAFSGHKMLGPSGVGVLYGREQLLEKMPPFLGGGSMIRRVYLDRFEPADLPAKFEAGTPPIVSAIGLGAAIDYLNRVGLEKIHRHELFLTRRAHEVLAGIGGVTFLGPAPEQKAGIVSFTVEGIHPHDVAQLLDRYGVAIRAGHHCAMPLHQRLGLVASSRASFYFYNTLADVDRLGEGIEAARSVLRKGRKKGTG
jgi:cysteine desulfurase/selenocysteine lyase